MDFMDSLGKNECIVLEGKIHWACLIPSLLLILLLHSLIGSSDISYGELLIFLIVMYRPLIAMLTTKLILTNKRLYGKVGLINTKTLDTPLNKVNMVYTSSGLFGKLLGYGTLRIASSSQEYKYNFVGLKSPDAFRSITMAQIDAFNEEQFTRQAAKLAGAISTIAE